MCHGAGLVAAVRIVILKHDLFGLRVEPLPGAIARPRRRREGVEGEIGFPRVADAGAVVEDETVAVRGESKGNSRVAAEACHIP
jgi:hypothetical protein